MYGNSSTMYSSGSRSGGGGGATSTLFDRKPSYTSDYYTSSSMASSRQEPSAYDRYISDLTGVRTSAYTTSSYSSNDLFGSTLGSSGSSRPSTSRSTTRTYVFEPDFEPMSSKYSSSSRNNYGRSSSDSYSTSRSSEYVPRSSLLSSRLLNSGGISSAPAYDKFGKELSNYERWKLSGTGGTYDIGDTITSNNDFLSRCHVSGGESEAQALRRKRLVNNIDSPRDERGRTVAPTSSSSNGGGGLTNGFREYSVAPTSIKIEDAASDLPAITGSRFSGRTGTGSRRSVEPFLPSISSSVAKPSSSSGYGSTKYVTSFPSDVKAKLLGYDVRDVRGDGGCYYRCLSVYFTGEEDSYNRYRKEVMSYIKQNEDNYKSMIRSEVGYASINDYFVRKTRSDRQEFAETTEIIATSCLYNINVHVLALVPGSRRSWEWLHFDPSIGTGRPSTATRDIYLYNQGSVHFMLCTPK